MQYALLGSLSGEELVALVVVCLKITNIILALLYSSNKIKHSATAIRLASSDLFF
jgi:hypothetical protein